MFFFYTCQFRPIQRVVNIRQKIFCQFINSSMVRRQIFIAAGIHCLADYETAVLTGVIVFCSDWLFEKKGVLAKRSLNRMA